MVLSQVIVLTLFWSQQIHYTDDKAPPDWVHRTLQLQSESSPGKQADAWRLLDDYLVTYQGDGELRIRHRLIYRILSESGREQGSTFFFNTTEGVSDLEEVQGWHLHPNGAIENLTKAQQVTIGTANDYHAIHRDSVRIAHFDRTVPGSTVAFESFTTHRYFLGPVILIDLLAPFPTMKFRLECAVNPAVASPTLYRIVPFRTSGWGLRHIEKDSRVVTLTSLPPVPSGDEMHHSRDFYPGFAVFFDDPAVQHFDSWNHLASWYQKVFCQAALGASSSHLQPASELVSLAKAFDDISQRLTYRQLYLDPNRGWLPEQGDVVFDQAFGDCKDMVSCLAFGAAQRNIAVLPALTSIGPGHHITQNDTPNPFFNHVIAAIPLKQASGMSAEIDVDGERFLLADPTARGTPFGLLPAALRGRDVMVCRPKGAVWVSIPDAMTESARVSINVTGTLDAAQNFVGTWRVHEEGNRLDLRNMALSGSLRHLADHLKRSLDLPGMTDVELTDSPRIQDGIVDLTFAVRWPGFLLPDSCGFRLPEPIVLPCPPPLTDKAHPQLCPFEIPNLPQIRWHLAVDTPIQLTPAQAQAAWSKSHHAFTWTAAEKEGVLTVDTSISVTPTIFRGAKGVSASREWDGFCEAYERFFRYAALLRGTQP